MALRVTAPNRIDLAGGTTDIYPLYLFMSGGCTVNAGITVTSTVVFRNVSERVVRIVSDDLGKSLEAPEPDLLPVNGPLGLISRAVKALPVETGIEIVTHNQAPVGSGLGASSALLVAVVTGLVKLRAEQRSKESIIDLSASIETAAIGVPTGKQDHIAALFGGVSAIEFGYTGFKRKECCPKPETRQRLEEMTILSYTGEGRFSGMNNWEVMKKFIEDGPGVRDKLVQIRNVARELCRSLEAGQWNNLPLLVDQEWKIRRSLAPGISNEHIDEIMAAAISAGASANKICGAGGGGCMISMCPPRKRNLVEHAISGAGGIPLPFKIDIEGIRSAPAAL